MKDKIYVCERCQVRLEDGADSKKVAFRWSSEAHKKLKLRHIKETGKKPERRLVRTSCLGHCPEGKVAYEELTNGQMSEGKGYLFETEEESVYKLLFKPPDS